MNGAVTVLPSGRVKDAGAVSAVWNGTAHGSFRWIALTRTMRVVSSSEPWGRRSLILSAVVLLTQPLMVCRAGSHWWTKSST